MTKEKRAKTNSDLSPTLRTNLQCSSIIALCFLWASTGYLSWLYHLMDFVKPTTADWLTEVIGYLFQTAGLFLFSLAVRYRKEWILKKSFFIGSIGIDFVFIVLSVLSNSLITVLIFGYLMNFFHGMIAGFYLFLLTTEVAPQYRSLVFGGAYGVASIVSWLLSLLQDANFLRSDYALIFYGIFICITIGIILSENKTFTIETVTYTKKTISTGFILLAGITVLLLSLTRGIGFYFPIADLSQGINLEFSRAFYAFGLIIAGCIGDRSRKYGAVSCLIALVFPFAMIALSNELHASIVLWVLGYAFFGFLTVFRVVVFTDIACAKENCLYVVGYGLMFGRIGDAVGSLTGMTFSNQPVFLVLISSICFVITFITFFILYNKLYMPVSELSTSSEELVEELIQKYEISPREAEVFKLLIAGSTNGEIAKQLFISENTVKFHVRNILKKTGCTNRTELTRL